MQIRRLEEQEIPAALQLVREVFDRQIAPGYPEKGRISFYQFIEEKRIRSLFESQQVFFMGCMENGFLYGCGMADTGGHICLLFMHPSRQGQGWGRQLLEAICQNCIRQYALTRVTVNAVPSAVDFYRKCGFVESIPAQEKDGIVYCPMEQMFSAAEHVPSRTKNRRMFGFLIGGILLVLVLAGSVTFFAGRSAVRMVGTAVEEYQQKKEEEEFQKALEHRSEEDFADQEDDPEAKEYNGIVGEYKEGGGIQDSDLEEEMDDFDRMESYIASDLRVQLEEESYELHEENEQEHLEFSVHYPQLKNLPGEMEDQVNQVLKDAAMLSVDQFYLDPSQELQEFYSEEESLYFGSEVEYKITYLTDDLISVAFSDHYFIGHWAAEFLDLRTRVVNLKTGDVYWVEDVLEADDILIDAWRERMLEHEPDSWALRELPADTFARTLKGEAVDGRYVAGILLTKNGVEFGFTYHYRSTDGKKITRGWQIGEFTLEEIKNYKIEHEMWNLVESDN